MAKKVALLASLLALFGPIRAFAILGLDMAPLLELVSIQTEELARLSEQLDLARDQREVLVQVNQGIQNTVSQIQAIQSILERAKDLDPTAVRSLKDVNDLLARAKSTQFEVRELLGLKIELSNQAIAQASIQSDTAYRMGQEMMTLGGTLARESESASPGRAAQISASSDAARLLSEGVVLQTLSQIAQLQSMQLEFLKSKYEQDFRAADLRRGAFSRTLESGIRRRTP